MAAKRTFHIDRADAEACREYGLAVSIHEDDGDTFIATVRCTEAQLARALKPDRLRQPC